MGPKERRAREREETRERILTAAREMFATDGIEAVTMRAIAKRIEYTPTAIYHHFKDKESLLDELTLRDFQTFTLAFSALQKIADPIERARRIGLTYVDFGLEHPSHYRFMFMTVKPPPSAAVLALVDHKNPEQDAYALLRVTLEEGITAGRFRPELDDPDQLAQVLWAGVHGIVSLHIAKVDAEWIDWRDARENARVMADVLIRGIVR